MRAFSKRLALGTLLSIAACSTRAARPADSAPPGEQAAPEPTTGASAEAISGGRCTGPLAEFCRNVKCASYEVTHAMAEKHVSPTPGSGGDREIVVQFGECGGTRFIRYGDIYEGWTEYYDSSGQVIGATRYSDTLRYCGGKSLEADYGRVPACR